MGINGKNLKITPQIFKLLMEIAEQGNPNIPHKVLLSEFGTEAAKFLIKEDYLTSGRALEHYWVGDDDVTVHWNEKLNSFVYFSDAGKYITIKEEELKTYDINIEKIVNFLATELDVLESSRSAQNQHLEGILYFVGNAHFQKKKAAVFFTRRLNDNLVFKKVEEFFLRESTSSLPKIILTSSNPHCPESLKSKAKVISIPKLLGLANSKALFNTDYIANILFGKSENEPKPNVYCSENGSNLHIGNKSWKVNGDKQRQIIKIMCDFYIKNPADKIRWINILEEADIETESRFRDMFRKSAVAEAINYSDGFLWFKTEEDF
jgi:hypothetical protein